MCAIAFRSSTLSHILPTFIKAKHDWPGECVVIFDALADMRVYSLGRISAMALSHRSLGRTLLPVGKALTPTEGSGCHEIAVRDVTLRSENCSVRR